MEFLHLRFLSRGVAPSVELTGSYEPALVGLSILVASIAAFAALLTAERLSAADRRSQRAVWLTTGAFAMGSGIWCMHFIGMLAFKLPIPVYYDPLITVVSMLPSIVASAIALRFISRRAITFWQANLGGAMMGIGIGTMHYTGMAAMIMDARMAYDPVIFVLSVIVAHVLATASLYVKFSLQESGLLEPFSRQLIGAFIMGCAVAGMHYTGMAAAHYFPSPAAEATRAGMGPATLLIPVSLGTFLVLAIMIATTAVYRRLQSAALTIQRLMESMPEALVTVDPRGRIYVVNGRTEDIFGYSRGELLGRPLEILLPERFRAPHLRHRARYLEAPRVRLMGGDRPLYGLRKDGAEFPIDVSLSHEETPDGIFVTSIIRDITEHKRMETLLLQSEKLAAVGQLAAGVSHELNNPLGIILGFAQGLANRIKDDDPMSLPIKSIEREALRCRNLVQNLLAFSRQDSARMNRFDLNEVVSSIVNVVEARARVNSVEIVKELSPLEPLWGDKNQLQQVLVNLCNNAIDAMPRGGKITLRTFYKSPEDRGEAVLEVEDTGDGIPEDIRNKIFNPFFTTKEVGKGTGLGLSLVHEIVQNHQGRIDVRSEVGRGTTFTVFLPAKPIEPRQFAS